MPGGSPSMTTPTAGPCDSPNVVTRNSWPKVEDTTRWVRLLLLDDRDARRGLRVLARGELGDRALPELLVRRDHALELVQVGRPDVRARLFDPALAALPRNDVLARVIEEQLVVQHAAVHQGSHHLPVRRRHPEVAVLVGVRQITELDLGPALGVELGEEPLPRLS